MGTARRLGGVSRDLTLLEEQGRIAGSLTNTENAQKINGLVEDIREALVDYQVCTLTCLPSMMPDIHARHHYNKISMIRVVDSL